MMRPKLASLFLLSLLSLGAPGCGLILGIAGYPPEAMRKERPPGLQDRFIAVGSPTAAITLRDSDNTPVTFGGPSAQRTLLFFYRGHW